MFLGGIDEAGRGSVFGPLVIAGVSFDSQKIDTLENMCIMDSKKISPKRREFLYEEILKICESIFICKINCNTIDKFVKINKLNNLESKFMTIIAENLNAKKMTENLLPFCGFADDWQSFYNRKIFNGIRLVYPFLLNNTYQATTISPNSKGGNTLKKIMQFVENYKVFPLYQLFKWRRKINIIQTRRCFIVNKPVNDFRRTTAIT